MTPQQPPAPREPQPPRYTWSEVWTAVLTKPSVNTFSEILHDPAAVPRRALVWLYLTGCFSVFIVLYTSFANPELQGQLLQTLPTSISTSEYNAAVLTSLICMVPLAGFLSLGVFWLFGWGVQYVAERVGTQEQTQGQLPRILYVLGSIIAPLNILSLIFVLIPALSVISILATLYQVALMGLGVMAVYGFRPREAALALGIPMIIFVMLVLLLAG